MVSNWAKRTPKDFKFTAKFPRVITHEKRLKDADKELDQFFDAIGPLSEKTLALLIQLPPSMQIFEGLESLRELARELDTRFRYAVEVRQFAPNVFSVNKKKIGGVKTLNVDHLNQLGLNVRIPIGETRFNVVRIALTECTRIVWIPSMRIP
jgi:uncharacterized protein YecE (DUF72 family)